MDPIGILSLLVFFVLTASVLVIYVPFLKVLARANRSAEPSLLPTPQPLVQIFLSLRGTDPHLDRCLQGLMRQNYDSYRVMIIVDSAEDEALPHAKELEAEHGPQRVQVMLRTYLHETCTRKLSSLYSGFDQVGDDVQIVVVCDGDAVPHRNWLQDLVRPIVIGGEKATSGNRWYVPENLTVGNMFRYYWNAMAVPRMYKEGILWAGSMAISREIFDSPDFLYALQHGFSEDTKIANYLHSLGYSAGPQPEVPVINTESVSLSSFWNFLVRQLLAAKLHHRSWSTVLSNALLMGFAMWILLPISLYRGATAFYPWLIGVVIYAMVSHICINLCEWRIRKLVKQSRGETLAPYTWRRILLSSPALASLSFVYPVAALVAAFSTTHTWRGIQYRILKNEVHCLPSSETKVRGDAAFPNTQRS